MENKEKLFLKVGDRVMFKPKVEGLEYNLEAGKVYTVEVDNWSDAISFKIVPDLVMPEKLYETEDSTKFINKVIDYFNKSTDGTTGVMLSGLKGSGKTITAKNIALHSNLPIILIDKSFRSELISKLFNLLENVPACIMFDEIDKLGKHYADDYLLKVLDGANTCGKKLFLCTCNDTDAINEYLKDRCSRIRYWKKFDEVSPSLITEILNDKLNDKSEVGALTDFIVEKFECASFDNIVSFADEVNEYPTASFEELLADMNLSTKQ